MPNEVDLQALQRGDAAMIVLAAISVLPQAPLPGCERRSCAVCDAECWIAPGTLTSLAQLERSEKTAVLMCGACHIDVMALLEGPARG